MSPVISVTKSFVFVLLDLPAALNNIYHLPLNSLLALGTSHLRGFHLPPQVLLPLVIPSTLVLLRVPPWGPTVVSRYTFSLELQLPS